MDDSKFFEVLPFEYDKKDKSKGVRWDLSQLDIIKFKKRAEKNPSFYNVFNPESNLTKTFKAETKRRTRGEKNFILEITGATGIGKSILAITLGLDWMNKKLDDEDVCFTSDLLIRRAGVVRKSHLLIQDEQTRQFGVGSNREEFERINIEETTRKFGLSMIFCSPTSKEHSSAHYILEVICRCSEERLTKVAIINDGVYLGYFVIKVVDETNPFWIRYNKRKDLFIKSVKGRDVSRMSLDEQSKELSESKELSLAGTRQEMKIVATKLFPTLTGEEVNMIVDNYRMLHRAGRI